MKGGHMGGRCRGRTGQRTFVGADAETVPHTDKCTDTRTFRNSYCRPDTLPVVHSDDIPDSRPDRRTYAFPFFDTNSQPNTHPDA